MQENGHSDHKTCTIIYFRKELLQHRERPTTWPEEIPKELRRKRQGTRPRVLMKNKKTERMWGYKPFLPSIIMGNVCSLKMDELSVLVSRQREYQESSLLCQRVTWLNGKTPDCAVELAGFSLVRADRDRR